MMVSVKALGAIALTMVIVCPVALGYLLSVHNEDVVGWETTEQKNISEMLLNESEPYYMTYTGSSNNNTLVSQDRPTSGATLLSPVYRSVGGTYSSYPIQTIQSGHIPIGSGWVTVDHDSYLLGYGSAQLKLHYYNGSVEVVSKSSGSTEFYKTNTGYAVLIGSTSTEYYNVDYVEVNTTEGVPYTYFVDSGQYADINAGWAVPLRANTSINEATHYWTNGRQNSEVNLLIGGIDPGYPVTFYINPITDRGGSVRTLEIDRSSVNGDLIFKLCNPMGTVYETQSIRAYPYVSLTITNDEYILSGCADWYPYGTVGAKYDTIVLKHNPVDSINVLLMGSKKSTNSSNAYFRVDSTVSLAGYYPVTKDYSLDLNSIYLDGSRSVSFNSIGMYGDSITIGDTTYSVTNGRITIDGHKVALKGAVIGFLQESGSSTITGTINGREFGSFTSIPQITFNGEWSLTAIAYHVEQVSKNEKVWHAGEFGLDKNGLIAGGLIMAVVAFIACGMSGKMSGAKVAVLSIICGGSALVYLIML